MIILEKKISTIGVAFFSFWLRRGYPLQVLLGLSFLTCSILVTNLFTAKIEFPAKTTLRKYQLGDATSFSTIKPFQFMKYFLSLPLPLKAFIICIAAMLPVLLFYSLLGVFMAMWFAIKVTVIVWIIVWLTLMVDKFRKK